MKYVLYLIEICIEFYFIVFNWILCILFAVNDFYCTYIIYTLILCNLYHKCCIVIYNLYLLYYFHYTNIILVFLIVESKNVSRLTEASVAKISTKSSADLHAISRFSSTNGNIFLLLIIATGILIFSIFYTKISACV